MKKLILITILTPIISFSQTYYDLYGENNLIQNSLSKNVEYS